MAPRDFEVLGRFHEYLSITEYRVSPVIAISKHLPALRPNPAEVASVLKIPLRFFLDTIPRVETRSRLGVRRKIYFYDYRKESVWGLTAAIIRDFCALLQSSPGTSPN